MVEPVTQEGDMQDDIGVKREYVLGPAESLGGGAPAVHEVREVYAVLSEEGAPGGGRRLFVTPRVEAFLRFKELLRVASAMEDREAAVTALCVQLHISADKARELLEG